MPRAVKHAAGCCSTLSPPSPAGRPGAQAPQWVPQQNVVARCLLTWKAAGPIQPASGHRARGSAPRRASSPRTATGRRACAHGPARRSAASSPPPAPRARSQRRPARCPHLDLPHVPADTDTLSGVQARMGHHAWDSSSKSAPDKIHEVSGNGARGRRPCSDRLCWPRIPDPGACDDAQAQHAPCAGWRRARLDVAAERDVGERLGLARRQLPQHARGQAGERLGQRAHLRRGCAPRPRARVSLGRRARASPGVCRAFRCAAASSPARTWGDPSV
jgi:hypothetical protein